MGLSGFHRGKNWGEKSHGCKKTTRPPKAAETFWPFFLCKINISVGFFLTSQEVNFLTFQNFTDVRFGPFSNLAGVNFREKKLKSHGRKIWRLFLGNFVEEGQLKKNKN